MLSSKDSDDDTPTTICLNLLEGRYEYLLLMLDKVSGINLVRLGALRDDVRLDNEVIELTGITPGTVFTLGLG